MGSYWLINEDTYMELAYHRGPRAIGWIYRFVESDDTGVSKRHRMFFSIWPRCALVLIFPIFRFRGTNAGCRSETPNRNARRRAHRWLWGVVDSVGHTRNYMRLLPPPAEAEGGAPRGTLELTQCLRAAGLLPDSLVVADGWRGYNRVDWLGGSSAALNRSGPTTAQGKL